MTASATDRSENRGGYTRQWLGLAVLLLPTLLMTVDLGVLWLATPALAADLSATSTELLWVNDIYGFVIASLLVVMGNLGDRYGHRRLLAAGAWLFVIASLAAAYAPSPIVLILARALLGVAGASIMPSTLALITNMFSDPSRRARAIALWVTALSAGVAIGPVISGLMLEKFWWGSVFLVGVPVMLIALVAAPFAVPEHRSPDVAAIDWAGVPLLLLALFPFVYAVKRLGSEGGDLVTVGAFVVAVVAGVTFVRRQRRRDDPLLDIGLFADRTFATALLLLFVGLAAMNGVNYLVPQYFQVVAQLPSVLAGLLMMPPAIGLVIGAQLTPVLAARMRPAYVIALGAMVAVVAFVLLTRLPADGTGVALAVVAATMMMAGLAPITVLGTAIAVGAVPPGRAGQAGAVGQTSYELGLAFGIAATGSAVAAVYRGEVVAAAPDGAPAGLTAAVADNLSGGVVLAERLGGTAGQALAAAARTAFTAGFHAAAVVGGVLTLLFLAVAVVLLRAVPVMGPADPQAGHGTDASSGDGAEVSERAARQDAD